MFVTILFVVNVYIISKLAISKLAISKLAILRVLKRTNVVIITLSNVLSFMITEVVFFWEIASNNVERLIHDKSTVLIKIVQQFPEIAKELDVYLNSSDYENLKRQALFDRNNRNEYNIALIWSWMLTPFIVVISILVTVISIDLLKTKKFDKTDMIVLSTVFVCFIPEVVFYFAVIYRANIISDIEVIQLVSRNYPISKMLMIFNQTSE